MPISEKIIQIIKSGGIGVMPTDTIYGLIGSALIPETVAKIYRLRKRPGNKPFIILIGSMTELGRFGAQLTDPQRDFLVKNWPNPLSVILPALSKEFDYLARGKKSLAFRMPRNGDLLELLKKSGPLVAPSANPAGLEAAETIAAARGYFGAQIDFYLDGGRMKTRPSTLIKLHSDGSWRILREGSFKLS